MDKNYGESASLGRGIAGALSAEIERRKKDPKRIIVDLLVFSLTFLFSRFHLAFGTYPLATAFVAAAPVSVWLSLLGAVVGALSLGEGGVIYAMISLIVAFLRVVISGGKKEGAERTAFAESLILRIAASVIGAFIGAVYELLLSGISGTAIIYSVSSCIFAALFTFVFYGLFESGLSFSDIAFGKMAVFEKRREGREKYNWIFFQFSSLVLMFFISLSLSSYNVLGIDLAFVFSSFAALFTAKRFGAVRAMAVGFVSSFGVSGAYSVAFALLGLGSGIFFPIAQAYAFLAGGALLSAWSAYVGQLVGFLTTLPEFAIAVALFFPFSKAVSQEKKMEEREDSKRIASDMVGSVALSHRNERGGGIDRLTSSVAALSGVVRRFGKSEKTVEEEDIREALLPAVRESCALCPNYQRCVEINPAPCAEIINDLSTIIYKNDKIFNKDKEYLPDYCENREYLFERIKDAYGELLSENYKHKGLFELGTEYELISKIINEAKLSEEREWCADTALSEKLEERISSLGLSGCVARVFGDRKKRFVIAGEDKDGSLLSSPELREAVESITGYRLAAPEFFRKGEIALMDSLVAPVFAVDFAASSSPAPDSAVSGDTADSFVSDGFYFYSLLSDGMGSGEGAKSTSLFVSEFLKSMLSASVSENTALHILNHVIRQKREESSATVDLFRFDLLSGEAVFVKSGAAASYVKRADSLFRVRSETVPIGLMKGIDSEKIRVACEVGDTVIMLSDGICDSPDSASWLPELLSRSFEGSIKEYADSILAYAQKKSRTKDDMTVAVAKIREIQR